MIKGKYHVMMTAGCGVYGNWQVLVRLQHHIPFGLNACMHACMHGFHVPLAGESWTPAQLWWWNSHQDCVKSP